MVILRFRTESDAKELLKKLKKMHKFSKELIECVEEKYEDDEEFDDEEDYRHDMEEYEPSHINRAASYRSRYRRRM